MGFNTRQSAERYIRLGVVCAQLLILSSCVNKGTMTETITCAFSQHNYYLGNGELLIAELTRGQYEMGQVMLDLAANRIISPNTSGAIIKQINPIDSNSSATNEVVEKSVEIFYGGTSVVITQGFNQDNLSDFITCEER